MDYHVFLLSRIKEHYDETGDNAASVAHGLRSTAGIITGAALIMVAVFAGMASGELIVFQQVGFGLAVAIILDATIIRMVLVPASMELLGDWNWYFPKWLEWLPKINIEGALQPANGAHEAAAAPTAAAMTAPVTYGFADASNAMPVAPIPDAPRRKGSTMRSFLVWLGLGLVALVVVAAAISGTAVALAVSGGPDACEPGGDAIVIDQANTDAFNGKWHAFEAALGAGSPASVTFNESEVTSRLNAWNDEKDVFEEIQVCLHDGYGEATGTLGRGGVVDAAFKLTGTVALDGDHPQARIDDIDVGKVPGFVLALWEGEAEDPIDDALDNIVLGHTYTVTYTEGAVRIDGQP
jgi:hypothetical protein